MIFADGAPDDRSSILRLRAEARDAQGRETRRGADLLNPERECGEVGAWRARPRKYCRRR